MLQDPSRTALWGRAERPGLYELRRLKVKDLQGVTDLNPPEVGFEVEDTPEAVGRGAT